jgi:predicted metalloprotease with PDZ domain
MILRQARCKNQLSNREQETSGGGVRRFSLALLAFVWALFGVAAARAETLNVRISVVSLASPARVKIEGERSNGARAWSFRNIYANVMNLGERIENLSLMDASGAGVVVRKLAPGEYEAASAATRFSYEVRLDAPAFETDAAHVSWLTDERGFLMLGDLLPMVANEKGATTTGAVAQFNLPQNWMIASSSNKVADGRFEVADAEKAVFFVGQKLREKRERVGSVEFRFVTSGEWAFSDEDVAGMAADILKDHTETFGGAASESAMLMLAPFPQAAAADHWSAETRGQTVMLLSGKLPSKTAALSQLSFPLAHELFHLWIPNGLALDGNYDWFYEGFTLYQALRAGMRLNLLTFQDYLNALGRAFDAYKSVNERDKASLLDASEQRWTVSPTLVYNKGMLVAFLYDLTLRQQTRGKRSLDDVYRELFRLYHAPESRKDGNAAVLAVLNGAGGMQEFTRRYIERASAVDLAAAIVPFGLQIEPGGVRTHISVNASLSGAQRDLLRKFGYNEKEYGVSGHRGVK